MKTCGEDQIHTEVIEAKNNKESIFFPVIMVTKEESTTEVELKKKKVVQILWYF